jgi:hypothetical protein
MENQTDQKLWEEAEARAGFKRHLLSYVIVNLFLVGIWYLSTGGNTKHFWPIWPMFGWGIGLLFHYLGVYQRNLFFSAEAEYKKMKKNQ